MDDAVARFAAFLDTHLPAFRAEHPPPDDFATRRAWQRVLASDRWVGLSWPEADGGRELDIRSRLACEALASERGAPEIAGVLGVNNVGPTLSQWGTPEQRQHLPKILTGEEIWCQGFSEPDAGSDLASLSTRAERVRGGYRITGQKVWTSSATDANWCLLLAREDGERHRGITCFTVPLELDGIQIRPLRQMTGDAEFGEIFFDDVFVGDDLVLGPPKEGWRVATTTLGFERANTLSLAAAVAHEVDRLVEHARGHALREADREAIVRCLIEARTLRYLGARSLAGAEAGAPPGPEHSVLKLKWSQLRQQVALARAALAGPELTAHEEHSPAAATAWELLRSRASTIAGGTTEVLRNVLAERVLGLPR